VIRFEAGFLTDQRSVSRKNLRLGLALALVALLYIAAVVAFIIVY